MRISDLTSYSKSYGALALLACGVYYFRDNHGSVPAYALSTALVILFWYLNDLKLALANLRNILFLALVFGIIIIAVRTLFPTNVSVAKMGSPLDGDLNPGKIAKLKESHEPAIDIYFDHTPTPQERYYRTGILPYTEDGLHYGAKPVQTQNSQFPQATKWAQQNLENGDLEDDLKILKLFFADSLTYSLTPGALDSESPLDQFLFISRKGYCEHFAAALSTLLKAQGYKARVSVGYAGGRWNRFAGLLSFEDSDAHAWVEVQDPNDRKWQIIDPTNWVSIYVSEGRSDFELGWILAVGILLSILLLLSFFLSRKTGVDHLLVKLTALEKKKGLGASGLTISERSHRLMQTYPNSADAIRLTLALYYKSYYAKEPTPSLKKELNRSLRAWGRS